MSTFKLGVDVLCYLTLIVPLRLCAHRCPWSLPMWPPVCDSHHCFKNYTTSTSTFQHRVLGGIPAIPLCCEWCAGQMSGAFTLPAFSRLALRCVCVCLCVAGSSVAIMVYCGLFGNITRGLQSTGAGDLRLWYCPRRRGSDFSEQKKKKKNNTLWTLRTSCSPSRSRRSEYFWKAGWKKKSSTIPSRVWKSWKIRLAGKHRRVSWFGWGMLRTAKMVGGLTRWTVGTAALPPATPSQTKSAT